MAEIQKQRLYNLEERTLAFARGCRDFSKKLSKNVSNLEYIKQLIRAASSVGANYIEANEALSKKDKVHRMKISRKEAKEARYWLQLVEVDDISKQEGNDLIQEATELMNIFGTIIIKLS